MAGLMDRSISDKTGGSAGASGGRRGAMTAWTTIAECYNTDRLHWAPGMDNYETPLAAFCNKSAADGARRRDLEWAEADING